MEWPPIKVNLMFWLLKNMRSNHILELERETRACEQRFALSLTIQRSHFALNCQIYLHLILGGLKELAARRSSKEEKSLLKKLTRLRCRLGSHLSGNGLLLKFFDRWIFHCLTWRLTRSHLDDIYQEDFLFWFSCCREIFSTTTFSLQPNHVWSSGSPHQCSFVARVCLAWWRWCGSSPQCTGPWESLD